MITDIWKNEIIKKMFSKPIPPCTHMLHVFICMYMHACMCVSLCKCICMRTRVQAHVCVQYHICMCSVVSWCICAYDLLIILFSLSLSETNIVLHYNGYSAVPLWHGQFPSKSWQETNHYLSVRARCGVSFVSSTVVFNFCLCQCGDWYNIMSYWTEL